MSPPLILSTNENLELFKTKGFLIELSEKKYRCVCGRTIPLDQIKTSEEFYQCSHCLSSKKFRKNRIFEHINYRINDKKLLEAIRKKLESLGVKTMENYGKLSLSLKDNNIYLGFLEFPIPSLLDPQSKTLILYYHEPEYNKIKNTYLEKRLLDLGDFFNLSKPDFNTIVKHIESLENNKLIEVSKKITDFCEKKTFQDFEVEINKLFGHLRDKSIEIEKFLSLLKMNRNLFLGRKSVHVGGNHPVDVECIELFDYFNSFFNLDQNFGADTKKYCKTEISGNTIRDKLLSGSGKSFVIITNQMLISKSAWFELYKAKKNHGDWHIFIFDLDLLSLIVSYLNLEKELFNI